MKTALQSLYVVIKGMLYIETEDGQIFPVLDMKGEHTQDDVRIDRWYFNNDIQQYVFIKGVGVQ